ncbi:MAG: ATP-binding protein [Polyangiaceae bacterium]
MTDPKDDRIRALEDEVKRLSAMLESAPDFIARLTVEGRLLYINRLAPGFRMEDVLGTSIETYVPPDAREQSRTAIARALETGGVQQYANLGRNGVDTMGHYLTRISPVLEDGEVKSLVLIATDVSALEENRLLLQVALDATGLGTWTMNPDGTGSWDETTQRIFGVPPGLSPPNLSGMIQERIHEADRERIAQRVQEAVGGGNYGPEEHRVVLPDEEVRWVSASGIAVRDHEDRFLRLVGTVQDVTHRRALEARLSETQKLESIGRLAGGVAHDFNNMLTAILGNVDLATTASSLEEVRSLLAEVRVVAERSAALTAQLLAFARRQLIEPKNLDPNALIERFGALLGRVLGEQITLRVELDSRAFVRVDASQFEQVLLNLVTNARDSMPLGGEVWVATKDVELTERQVAGQLGVAHGPYVRIAVSDAGAGIAPEALPHVFEPFFTTRQGGTGLGLATCYGIIKKSGGHIDVHSELGRGTTFVVYLPRMDVQAVEGPGAPTPAPPSATGERVLLIEDEPAVRSVIERTLGLSGYRVTSASSGEAGLHAAETQPPFDLLITDAVMPGLSGWEVGKRLGARYPKLKILYISGYTEDVVAQGGVLDPGMSFLQKPFSPSELLRSLRCILDKPRG